MKCMITRLDPILFSGQQFIESTLGKLAEARKIIDQSGRDIRLEADSGVIAKMRERLSTVKGAK